MSARHMASDHSAVGSNNRSSAKAAGDARRSVRPQSASWLTELPYDWLVRIQGAGQGALAISLIPWAGVVLTRPIVRDTNAEM